MYSFSFSRAGCWQSGAGDFMLHEHAFPLRINLFSFSIWACWQWHHYGHAVQLHQIGVLFLLEVESVSTRIRVLLNPKETAIPLKTQHGSTLVVQRLGWNHAVKKGNTFVHKANMALWKEWGGEKTHLLQVRVTGGGGGLEEALLLERLEHSFRHGLVVLARVT